MSGFYAERASEPYYTVVREMLDNLGQYPSILDVGCWDTPVAAWGQFLYRWSLDTRRRPPITGVQAIMGSWPDYAAYFPPMSVVTCLQTLEHIVDAGPFAAALFDLATDYVIISVPYKWPAGQCEHHVHDPIDLRKLERITGRDPVEFVITAAPARRLIARYQVSVKTADYNSDT